MYRSGIIVALSLMLAGCGGPACIEPINSGAPAYEWAGAAVQYRPEMCCIWQGHLWRSVGSGRVEPGVNEQWVDLGETCR